MLLLACEQETVGPETGVATVMITPAQDTLRALGDSRQLAAVALDADGNPLSGTSFSWSSGSPEVATVSPSGVVTAVAQGSALITAGAGGTEGTATVVVRQAIASVAVTPDTITFTALGDSVRLSPTVLDARDNPVAGAEIAYASSHTAVATVDATGLATARGNGAARITATSGGITAEVRLEVRQAVAVLHVRTQPHGATSGAVIATQPVLELRDARGHVVAHDSTTAVTASIEEEGAILSGTISEAAVGGMVTFSDLSIAGSTGDYTLRFSAGGIAPVSSEPFALQAGAAASLVFLDVPSEGVQGDPIHPAISVGTMDAAGNATTTTGDVALALAADAAGVTLGGTTVVSLVEGLATFADVSIDEPGSYQLIATSAGLAPDTSGAIHVRLAAAQRLSIVAQPTEGVSGVTLGAIEVEALNRFGDRDPSFAAAVTLRLVSGAGTPSGDTIVNAQAGIARFENVAIEGAGSDFRLEVVAAGLTSDTTASLEVAPAGTTHVWRGATDSDWFAASNWSPASVPDSASVAFVPIAAPAYPQIPGGAVAEIRSVRLESGALITLDGTLSASESVQAEGGIIGAGKVVMRGGNGLVDADVPTLEVSGFATLARSIALPAELHVSGTLVLAGSRLVVGGQAHVYEGGTIRMTDGADTLDVGAHVTWNGAWNPTDLSAGLLIVRGESFGGVPCVDNGPGGTHLLRMAGASFQTLSGCMWQVEFANSDSVSFGGVIHRLARVTNGRVIGGTPGVEVSLSGTHVKIEDQVGGRWGATTVSDADTVTLPDSISSDALTIRGHTVLAGSSIVAGDLFVTTATGVLELGAHHLVVHRDANISGRMVMHEATGLLRVMGRAGYESWNATDLTAGVIEVAGAAFNASCGSRPGPGFRLVVNGTGFQSASSDCFGNVDFANPDSVYVNGSFMLTTRILAGHIVSDRNCCGGYMPIAFAGDSVTLEDLAGNRWLPPLNVSAARIWLPDSMVAAVQFVGTTYLEKSFTTSSELVTLGDVNGAFPIGFLYLNGHRATARVVHDHGVLYMLSDADTLQALEGYDLGVNADRRGTLQAGLMDLRGSVSFTGCGINFEPAGSHGIEFGGGTTAVTMGMGVGPGTWDCDTHGGPLTLWNVKVTGSAVTFTGRTRGDLELTGTMTIPATTTSDVGAVLRLRSGSTLNVNGTLNAASCEVEAGATVNLGAGAIQPCP